MKKRNVATAMATAMTLGTVVPAFAAVVETGSAVNVALSNAKEVSVKNYEEIYNTNFTDKLEDDTLKPGYEILQVIEKGDKKTDHLYVVSNSIDTSKMDAQALLAHNTAVKNAKTNVEDTDAYIELLISRGYKMTTTYATATTKTEAGKVVLDKAPAKTVTLTKEGAKAYEVRYEGVKYTAATEVDRKTIAIPEAEKVNGVETTTSIAKRTPAHREISKLAYDLGKMAGKIEVDKIEEGYSNGAHRDLVLKVYNKAEKASERTLIGEYRINNFAEFNNALFVSVEAKNDFSGHWAEKEIFNAMYAGNIDNSGKFRPQDSITRAEFVKILVNSFGVDTKVADKYKNPFTDVKEGSWEQKYVVAAYVAGVVEGDGDGTFRPNAPISRQEAAKMVATLAANQKKTYGNNVAIKGETFDSKGQHVSVSTAFRDDKDIAVWADESVKELNAAGVITGYGDNTYKPENSITRAESIVMMEKAATKLK